MADEVNPRKCARCGITIPEGLPECPQCGNRWLLVLRSRETVLSLSVLALIIFFLVTGAVVGTYHRKLQSLGIEWFEAGRDQLEHKNARAALADFRNSLVYNPDDARVEFQLAEALSAEGRNEEARSYLLGLLAHSPADSPVNLALARIAASAGSEADALRYYHGAIYGIWPSDPEANRLHARLELCRFLTGEHDSASADSELIALQPEIPRRNSAELHEQVGNLFLSVGDAERALAEFRRAFPRPGALRGAGLAAYQMKDYRTAVRYLERADREGHDPEIAETLETTRLILAWNPEAPGLRDVERRERVRHDLAQAISRAETCASSGGLNLSNAATNQESAPPSTNQESDGTQQSSHRQTAANAASGNATANPAPALMAQYALAKSLQGKLSDRNLARHPEIVDEAIDAIFDLEAAVTQKCGEPAAGIDKALEILDKNRQGGPQ